MNNVTYSAKKESVERKWYVIDAANKPLGRVATEAARLLRTFSIRSSICIKRKTQTNFHTKH